MEEKKLYTEEEARTYIKLSIEKEAEDLRKYLRNKRKKINSTNILEYV